MKSHCELRAYGGDARHSGGSHLQNKSLTVVAGKSRYMFSEETGLSWREMVSPSMYSGKNVSDQDDSFARYIPL